MRNFHQALSQCAASQDGFRYYYVTAYEMAPLVKQAEQGLVEPNFDFPATCETASARER